MTLNPFLRIPHGALTHLFLPPNKSCKLMTESAASPAMKKTLSFAEQIERARGHRTAIEFALLLDVPYRTFRNWESGHQVPPPYVQALILERAKKMSLKAKPEPAVK